MQPNRVTRRQFAALTGALATSLMVRDVLAQDATPMATPVASPVGEIRVRRNAKDLTSGEKKAFTDAILALKAAPSPWTESISTYDQFVLWHRDAFECDLMAAHMGPAFFPWHRMFLHLFEEQLRMVDPSITLPYWDWTADQEPDSYLWQDDLMGGSGDPDQDYAVLNGPFHKDAWQITIFDETDDERFPHLIRNIGMGPLAPDLPTSAQLEEGLAIEHYDAAPWNEMADPATSFRNYLEGWRDCSPSTCSIDGSTDYPDCAGSHDMHNRVHLWVSGEMMFSHEGGHEDKEGPYGTMAWNSSPNDPVFFLHHTNVDRIWSMWLARHGQVYEPESGAVHGHNLHDHMWPYTEIGMEISPAMMLDSRSWGYVYDSEAG